MELKVGAVYHWLGYEDDDLSRPMITSMEYLGLDIFEAPGAGGESRHCFRIIGSEDDHLVFTAGNLPELKDVPGLIEELLEFQAGKHKLPPHKRQR